MFESGTLLFRWRCGSKRGSFTQRGGDCTCIPGTVASRTHNVRFPGSSNILLTPPQLAQVGLDPSRSQPQHQHTFEITRKLLEIDTTLFMPDMYKGTYKTAQHHAEIESETSTCRVHAIRSPTASLNLRVTACKNTAMHPLGPV